MPNQQSFTRPTKVPSPSLAEQLESRRYLSLPAFGPAVSTTLPAGFQLAQLIAGGDAHFDLIATSKTGGGLLLQSQPDGSYAIVQQVITSATIFGSVQIGDAPPDSHAPDFVTSLYTSQGIMLEQSDGSFAAPIGTSLPSDMVSGSAIIDDFDILGSQPATGPFSPADLVVETFVPNAGDPSLGTLGLADIPSGYLPEKDTILATNFPKSQVGDIVSGDFNSDGYSDIVAGGQVYFGNGTSGFTPGPSLNLPASSAPPMIYAESLVSTTSSINAPLDLLVDPAPGSTASGSSMDTAEILVGNGTGNFSPDGDVAFGPAGTTTAPLIFGALSSATPNVQPGFIDVNDIAANITSGPDSPGLAFDFNFGNGTFLPPVDVATPGVAQGFYSTNNGTSEYLLCITSNGMTGALAQFSIVASPVTTPAGPVVQLSVTPASAVVGDAVVLKALIGNVFNPDSISSLEFGAVNFMDGSVSLGTSNIGGDGSAMLTTTMLSAGTHSITATFMPPAGASTGTSPVVSVTINNPVPQADLTLESLSLTLPGRQVQTSFPAGQTTPLTYTVVPGDKGSVQLKVRNRGQDIADGKVAVQLYATQSGAIDSSAIPIAIASLASRNVHVGGGATSELMGAFTVPQTMPAGTYIIAARLSAIPGSPLSGQFISTAPVSFAPAVSVVWGFGSVGPRIDVPFIEHLPAGGTVIYRLSGDDSGAITEAAGPLTLSDGSLDASITITGEDNTSFTVSHIGTKVPDIVALNIDGSLGSADLRNDSPNSIASSAASIIGQLKVGALPIAHPMPGVSGYAANVAGSVNLAGVVNHFSAARLDGAVALNTAGGSQISTINVAALDAGCAIQSGSPIKSLRAGSAAAGSSISAPSIENLICSGDFNASMALTGTATGAAVLGNVAIAGSIAGGTLGADRWTLNGNVGKIKIAGDVDDLQLLGGALAGSGGSLLAPSASFSATSIQSFIVGGSVDSTLLAAGLDPVDGILIDATTRLLPGGSIGSITIHGQLSADSRILANSLPTVAMITNSRTPTANDPRFQA